MKDNQGQTEFAVHYNQSAPFVMAYVCTCGVLSVAFGEDAYGMFGGTCDNGHDATIMAS